MGLVFRFRQQNVMVCVRIVFLRCKSCVCRTRPPPTSFHSLYTTSVALSVLTVALSLEQNLLLKRPLSRDLQADPSHFSCVFYKNK